MLAPTGNINIASPWFVAGLLVATGVAAILTTWHFFVSSLETTVRKDPAKDCQVFLHAGCAHVDGPGCDMDTCKVRVMESALVGPTTTTLIPSPRAQSMIPVRIIEPDIDR